jgi:hypothetical protein
MSRNGSFKHVKRQAIINSRHDLALKARQCALDELTLAIDRIVNVSLESICPALRGKARKALEALSRASKGDSDAAKLATVLNDIEANSSDGERLVNAIQKSQSERRIEAAKKARRFLREESHHAADRLVQLSLTSTAPGLRSKAHKALAALRTLSKGDIDATRLDGVLTELEAIERST